MSKDRYHHITDSELLQKYTFTQNNEWLGILLQRYTLLLLGVCMKYLKNESDAQDCVQQIFLKVMQEAAKYKIEYFKSWLYRVAINQCLTVIRSRKGKIPVALTEINALPPLEEIQPSDDLLEQALFGGLLEQALQELNKAQYNCVTLFYLQKQSYQQISDATGYPLLSVKSHIQNGKRNLRISIEKKLKDV